MKCRPRKIVRVRGQAEKMGCDERKLIWRNLKGKVHVKEIHGTVLLVRQRERGNESVGK